MQTKDGGKGHRLKVYLWQIRFIIGIDISLRSHVPPGSVSLSVCAAAIAFQRFSLSPNSQEIQKDAHKAVVCGADSWVTTCHGGSTSVEAPAHRKR